jgi:hypothetical protein
MITHYLRSQLPSPRRHCRRPPPSCAPKKHSALGGTLASGMLGQERSMLRAAAVAAVEERSELFEVGGQRLGRLYGQPDILEWRPFVPGSLYVGPIQLVPVGARGFWLAYSGARGGRWAGRGGKEQLCAIARGRHRGRVGRDRQDLLAAWANSPRRFGIGVAARRIVRR